MYGLDSMIHCIVEALALRICVEEVCKTAREIESRLRTDIEVRIVSANSGALNGGGDLDRSDNCRIDTHVWIHSRILFR